MDWAKRRRRKAAAKCYLRLDLATGLPRFAVIEPAIGIDAGSDRQVCADDKEGEVIIFDRAYLDFASLFELTQRGVCWVTRIRGEHAIPRCQKWGSKNRTVIFASRLPAANAARARPRRGGRRGV